MNFVAIDVETANPDQASICQIGLVVFDDGAVTSVWQRLINPEDDFDGFNVSIHGISEGDVIDAPTFPNIVAELQAFLNHKIVVSHTAFDRVALNRVTAKYSLPEISCIWLDSAKIVRRTWPKYAQRGYGLKNVATSLGLVFDHHVAKEDARAAGEIVLRAIAETGIDITQWLERVKQPITPNSSDIDFEVNRFGPLFGEIIVFTGKISIPRRDAARIATEAGCRVTDSINASTTLLIVGDQDARRLAGHEKSSKQRKAEELITRGGAIRILTETDFRELLGLD
jgi:DNA polymerase-3 subunit epsilon